MSNDKRPVPSPVTSPLHLLFDRYDLRCKACGYNLRGLRSSTCPECGAHLDISDFTPKLDFSHTRQFRAARMAAASAIGLVFGLGLFELPAARRAGSLTSLFITCAISLATGLAWLATTRRFAALRPHIQGRIAAAMWVIVTSCLLLSLAGR